MSLDCVELIPYTKKRKKYIHKKAKFNSFLGSEIGFTHQEHFWNHP